MTHANSFAKALAQLSIVRAENDLLYADNGDRFIDLLTGGGTSFLGHSNPDIVSAVQTQLSDVWITSTLPTPVVREAKALVESFFPPTHGVGCIYSTGMEAGEFALRVARVSTGQGGVIGFENCMHGKSVATASLGWPNRIVELPDQHCLPYLARCSEDQILQSVEERLATESIAAVMIEPLAGSGGGYLATPRFAQELSRLCRQHGALLICDEIFTAFYRTGDAFLHHHLGTQPDIVLMGKTMGNGFPVSAVVVDKKYPIEPEMLPHSTYSGNSLAASAIVATLRQMQQLDLPAKVVDIEETIIDALN